VVEPTDDHLSEQLASALGAGTTTLPHSKQNNDQSKSDTIHELKAALAEARSQIKIRDAALEEENRSILKLLQTLLLCLRKTTAVRCQTPMSKSKKGCVGITTSNFVSCYCFA
jgi:hypothetical protein